MIWRWEVGDRQLRPSRIECRGRDGRGWRGLASIGCRVDLLTACSGLLRLAQLPVTRPAIHNSRVPVASVSRPQGGGLLAVLWPQGWVYWPNNGHCSPCHTKLLSVTRRPATSALGSALGSEDVGHVGGVLLDLGGFFSDQVPPEGQAGGFLHPPRPLIPFSRCSGRENVTAGVLRDGFSRE